MKSRLYLDDKGKAYRTRTRFDSWRQCWTCGDIVKINEVKIESSISDVVEVDDSNIKEEIQPLFTKKRKTRLERLREERATGSIKDPDVKTALKKEKRVTRYEEYQVGE